MTIAYLTKIKTNKNYRDETVIITFTVGDRVSHCLSKMLFVNALCTKAGQNYLSGNLLFHRQGSFPSSSGSVFPYKLDWIRVEIERMFIISAVWAISITKLNMNPSAGI